MELLIAALNSIGIIALCSLSDTRLGRVSANVQIQHFVTGLLFTFGGLVAMVQPIYMLDGAQADTRYIFIAFAFVFGSFVSGTMAAMILTAVGFFQGEPFATQNAILTICCGGLAYAWVLATKVQLQVMRKRSLSAWLVLALIVSLPNGAFGYDVSIMALEAVLVHVALNILCVLIFGRAIESERRRSLRMRELDRDARIDVLTGLPNRRAFMEYVSQSLPRSSNVLSLILIDVDHFKSFNDSFGHSFGDEVLSLVGQAIQKSLRSGDFAARIGGEEFAIILPTAQKGQAYDIAERLRNTLFRKLDYKGKSILLSASFGGVEVAAAEFDFSEAFVRADEALYRAKAMGRNRTSFTPVVGVDDDALLAANLSSNGWAKPKAQTAEASVI